MLIEAFFSGMKSLPDLIVQLISTEGIVRNKVHGFHRIGTTYEWKVLKNLKSNISAGREQIAQDIQELIKEQKHLWIDEVINARDQLIYPDRGVHHSKSPPCCSKANN
jgi:hypothetical protein